MTRTVEEQLRALLKARPVAARSLDGVSATHLGVRVELVPTMDHGHQWALLVATNGPDQVICLLGRGMRAVNELDAVLTAAWGRA